MNLNFGEIYNIRGRYWKYYGKSGIYHMFVDDGESLSLTNKQIASINPA